jgi:ATP-dependent Lhr-like helicase
MGPPEGAGRWWLVAETVGATPPGGRSTEPTGTERRAALAAALLERQGVVTRDGVLAESVVGGFGAVYGVLREMEERGRVRRGYFVEGLGGAQFALAGAVDRLRAARADAEPGRDGRTGTLTLAAADPANPYGAVLPWPGDRGRHDRTPTRSAGAYVVLHDGQLVVHLERGGRSLLTWPPFDDDEVAGRTIEALRSLTADGRLHRLQLERVDGREVAASPRRARLEALGFRASYRGLVLAPQRVAVGHRP